jgi:polyhydroxybutyrate depolymerase
LNWHGCNKHFPILDYHSEISKVTEEAMNRGFYSITPLGTKAPSLEADPIAGDYGWNADGISCGTPGVDDFEFFEALLEFTSQNLCADDEMIYTVGFSTGAFLSYGIACRYAIKIAGVGADAGGLSLEYYDTCRSQPGAVPVQAFHSLTDPTVPYNGTKLWAGQDAMDALWREKNGCDGSEIPKTSYESDTTTCLYWECPLAPVESCTLKDMDHCWYGGRSGGFPVCKPRIGDVDATKHMFDFWARNINRRRNGKEL